jgi:3,4-dihydroxy 2-butanone 4-phosphate synthase / GTP cyclohydrolase II
MARMHELEAFGDKHHLSIISVAELVRYRIQNEILVRRIAEALVPTVYGEFRAVAFENQLNGEVHLAMVMGDIAPDEPILVRVHTQSVLSDVFGSLLDNHGKQLQTALRHISGEKRGIVLYLKQEMRGVGLADQLQNYQSKDQTKIERKSHKDKSDKMRDVRDYGTGAQILHELGVRKLRLLSDHPPKLHALEGFDLEIVSHLPLTL